MYKYYCNSLRIMYINTVSDESIETEFIVVGQKCRNNKDLIKALEVSFDCEMK